MLPESEFWVIMLNDRPVSVCTSPAQSELELTKQKAAERLIAERMYGLKHQEQIEQHMRNCHFHVWPVTGSRIDHGR